MASVIAEVIFQSIALPAAYSDDCNREALGNVWNKLLLSKVCHCSLTDAQIIQNAGL